MMEDKTGRIIREVSSFFALFALVAFAVSCCMMLFLNTIWRAAWGWSTPPRT